MRRIDCIAKIRSKLASGVPTIGSWMQIPNASVAEIMGHAGYDWISVDMEHGTIAHHQLPDLFRSIELGGALPLVRLGGSGLSECKQALDAGAGGVIVPMIETAEQLQKVVQACRWPPVGSRGVGFSRANLFGKYFADYAQEAQAPLIIAMIEHIQAVESLDEILSVDGLDAILIGPYDLSASLGVTGIFGDHKFLDAIEKIRVQCASHRIPCGVHVVEPDRQELQTRISEGYLFLAYSIDAVFLRLGAEYSES